MSNLAIMTPELLESMLLEIAALRACVRAADEMRDRFLQLNSHALPLDHPPYSVVVYNRLRAKTKS